MTKLGFKLDDPLPVGLFHPADFRRDETEAAQGALPTESDERKKLPVATGVVDYFPDALVALAELSRIGNDKHNPGMPLHWSRGKSDDHPDALMRHFIERGKFFFENGHAVRHSIAVLWRAFAIAQLELEKAAIDAAEENAWRLGQREVHAPPTTMDQMQSKWRQGDAVRNEWRQGDAVRARRWPDIPEEAVGLPCDVERP